MSLRNTYNLMASMLDIASSVSFKPTGQVHRLQFNPVTGSWVFGLAAFAAGGGMKQGEGDPTPCLTPPKVRLSTNRVIGSPLDFREGSIRNLLRDTMEEESKSDDYLSNISSEVAKLREEVAALSAQKEQMRATSNVIPEQRPVSSFSEFEEMRNTISELYHALATQRSDRNNSVFSGELAQVQQELTKIKSEQQRILLNYEDNKHEAKEARSVMNDLKLLLDDKIMKLSVAEEREKHLRNEHLELITVVDNLKTQLKFFRDKTSQDQSGSTSLKILEDSNSNLVEQVNSMMQETEVQQATLKQLSAEKSYLLQQLDTYKIQAKLSEQQMAKLEMALSEAETAEISLLREVERLSAVSVVANKNTMGVDLLENARQNIFALETKETSLLAKLHDAENVGAKDASLNDDQLNSVIAQRDELKQALQNKDDSYKKLEANYLYKIEEAEDLSGRTKTDLVLAVEKKEELNDKIKHLVGKISNLENERDLYKSKSEITGLKSESNGDEYTLLKQTVLTLERENKSLGNELHRYKIEARIKDSLDKERIYKEEIEQIKFGIFSQQELYGCYTSQQNELAPAKQEIKRLIDAKNEKDKELEDARKNLIALKMKKTTHLTELKEDIARSIGKIKCTAGEESEFKTKVYSLNKSLILEDNERRKVRLQENELRGKKRSFIYSLLETSCRFDRVNIKEKIILLNRITLIQDRKVKDYLPSFLFMKQTDKSIKHPKKNMTEDRGLQKDDCINLKNQRLRVTESDNVKWVHHIVVNDKSAEFLLEKAPIDEAYFNPQISSIYKEMHNGGRRYKSLFGEGLVSNEFELAN